MHRAIKQIQEIKKSIVAKQYTQIGENQIHHFLQHAVHEKSM